MNEFRLQRKLMGCAFELILFHRDKKEADYILASGVNEIIRIEKLLTSFSEDSITSEINRNAGIRPVEAPGEVYDLLTRCIRLSEISQGAFDITTASLKELYNFRQESFRFPLREEIGRALGLTGYKKIHLSNKHQVYLEPKGMKISFDAIGKGYAADRVKKLWKELDVESGVINASGDITAIGNRFDGTPWKIGIANPSRKEEMLFYIPVTDSSVATSGDYEQYFIRNGIRHSHTIDPKTGLPVRRVCSVTVTGMSAEYCDALATAVTVMGAETGLHFIEQLPGTHCIIINGSNNVRFSKKIFIQQSV